MSKNPTVAALATSATNLVAGLTDAMARAFIRTHNIRSNGKLETLVKEMLVGKSETELKTLCAVPEGAAQTAEKPAAKKASSKKPAAKKAAKTTEAKPKFERKGRTKRTSAVNEGPRGFRFGPVWNNSVLTQEGIAMLDVHKNKLLKQAESLGINRFTAADDSAKIAKAIAPKLEAQIAAAE